MVARDVTALQPEGRLLLPNVSWASYVAISDALTASGSKAKLTYLEGQLEIMTLSRTHEELRILLARLLFAWAEFMDVELEGYGGMTMRKRAAKRGLEPDECYCVGRLAKRPDLALEVVVSSPLLDKLDVYRGLGIREVWVYQAKTARLVVHRLVGTSYREATKSSVLPTLDLAQLASFVALERSQTACVKAYRAALRA